MKKRIKFFIIFTLFCALCLIGLVGCGGGNAASMTGAARDFNNNPGNNPENQGQAQDKNQEIEIQEMSELQLSPTLSLTPTPSPSPSPTPDPVLEILSNMTLAEKVGQLFLIRPEQINPYESARLKTARSVMDNAADNSGANTTELTDAMRGMLDRYPAGGFILFAKNITSPEQVIKFNQDLKQSCKITPFLAIDEEGGRVARIANHAGFEVKKYKSMYSIGATGDFSKAYEAGDTIGGYLNQYGFNLDFAPDADLTTNPNSNSSGIGDRSFGGDPELVSEMVRNFISGLHNHGVLATLKHFPGHGDTSSDTHNGYVAVRKSWDELLNRELKPFINNFDMTDMIMVSHVTAVNAISDGMPATLSWELLTGKLRNELGYQGLLITDALEMGAITENYTPAEAAVMALEAGNDIILIPQDYPAAFDGILAAVWTGRIPESRIDESVKRILTAKLNLQNAG